MFRTCQAAVLLLALMFSAAELRAQASPIGYRFQPGTVISYQRTITTEYASYSRTFTEVLSCTLRVEAVDRDGNGTVTISVTLDTLIVERTRPYRWITSDLPIPRFRLIRVWVSPRGTVIRGERLDTTHESDTLFARRQGQEWFIEFRTLPDSNRRHALWFSTNPVMDWVFPIGNFQARRRDTMGLHVKLYNDIGRLTTGSSPCRQIVISRRFETDGQVGGWRDGRRFDPARTIDDRGANSQGRDSFHSVVDACFRENNGLLARMKETRIGIDRSGNGVVITDIIEEVQ